MYQKPDSASHYHYHWITTLCVLHMHIILYTSRQTKLSSSCHPSSPSLHHTPLLIIKQHAPLLLLPTIKFFPSYMSLGKHLAYKIFSPSFKMITKRKIGIRAREQKSYKEKRDLFFWKKKSRCSDFVELSLRRER